jgi:ribosomal subunit interface protein
LQTALRITFHGLSPSAAIEDSIRGHVAKLERFFDRIVGCHVTIEVPNHRHKSGRRYRVLVDVRVPRAELVAGRPPDESSSSEDVFVAIDRAFDEAVRVLQEHARMLREVPHRQP